MKREAVKTFLLEIKNLLGQSKIDKALNDLKEKLPYQNKTVYNEVISFKGRKVDLDQTHRKGNITYSEYTAKKNQLRDDILAFVDTLSEKDFKVIFIKRFPVSWIIGGIAASILAFWIYTIVSDGGELNKNKDTFIEVAAIAIKPEMIKVNDVQVGKYEITNREFAAFLNAKGNENYIEIDEKACRIKEVDGLFKMERGFEDYPVVEVTWYGAKAYCEWLSEKMGKTYELPNSKEWHSIVDEYPNTEIWHSGNSDNALQKKHEATKEIPADLLGNVWEWCMDDANVSDTTKVVKGGSFIDPLMICKPEQIGEKKAYKGDFNIGFRCFLRE